jgi:hypothetical protein
MQRIVNTMGYRKKEEKRRSIIKKISRQIALRILIITP